MNSQVGAQRTVKREIRHLIGALSLLMGFWMFWNAPGAQAQSLSLSATSALSFLPGQTEFEAGQITQSGAISLFVATDNPGGCTITVQGASAPSLKNADLLLRSSASGTASTFGSFAPLSSGVQTLWSTATAHPAGVTVWLDVRLRNLRTYSGGRGHAVNYSNVITVTVLPN